MFHDNSVQGVILDTLAKEGQKLHLFTVNGFRVNGRIVAADQYTVLMQDPDTGEQNLVYKHAISTIALGRGRKFGFDKAAGNAASDSSEVTED